MTWRRIFPERVFGSRGTSNACLKLANAPDPAAHHLDQFGFEGRRLGVHTVLHENEPQRHLALVLVGDAHHGALRHGGVCGDHLFEFAGRQTVAAPTFMTSSTRPMM